MTGIDRDGSMKNHSEGNEKPPRKDKADLQIKSGNQDSANLAAESRILKQCWDRHNSEFLKNYLVQKIQDPRINPQSILSRQVIIDFIFQNKFSEIKFNEILFSAVMLWIYSNLNELSDRYLRDAVYFALKKRADNVEGFSIPQYVGNCFKILPLKADGQIVPNYLKNYFETTGNDGLPDETLLNTFSDLWANLFKSEKQMPQKPTLLEPACGSANDYRIIHSIGLNKFIDYSGFDISEKNIANAQTLFPQTRFFTASVYDLDFEKNGYNIIIVHDLFEHLSPAGIDYSLKKLSDYCRHIICLNFFNMDETEEHLITPYEDYYWNKLSVKKICKHLSDFDLQIIHINSLFKEFFNIDNIYNPNAYTIIGKRMTEKIRTFNNL